MRSWRTSLLVRKCRSWLLRELRSALAIIALDFLPVDSLPPKFDFCFEWERLMIAGLLRLVLGRLFLLKLRTSELEPMDTSCVLPLLLWPALSMFM